MRRIDQQRLARLRERKLGPIPQGEDGITVQGEFLSFEDLHETCKQLMHPSLSNVVETELGKMHYSRDPTYNLRKRV